MKILKPIKLNKRAFKKLFASQRVVLAYLFGSVTRGTAGLLSDIDVAVMFEVDISAREQDKRTHNIAKEMEKQTDGYGVDMVNLKEVKSALMKYQIVFDGELIYAQSKSVAREFSIAVMREYEDMRYLYDLQFRLMEERLRKGSYGKQKVGSPYLSKYVTSQ